MGINVHWQAVGRNVAAAIQCLIVFQVTLTLAMPASLLIALLLPGLASVQTIGTVAVFVGSGLGVSLARLCCDRRPGLYSHGFIAALFLGFMVADVAYRYGHGDGSQWLTARLMAEALAISAATLAFFRPGHPGNRPGQDAPGALTF